MGKKFTKYHERGAGYHWDQMSNSLLKHNSFVSARFRFIKNLLRELGVQNKKILDVGCGDGVLVHKIARLGAKAVTGIDSSQEAITFAKERNVRLQNVNFHTGSAYRLPFQDRTFDYVTCSEVIEHLENPQLLLQEIRRVWNGTGAIVITTPIRLTKQPLDPQHIQEFFQEDFQSLILEFFSQTTILNTHPLFWKEFQQKRILGKPAGKILLNLCEIVSGFNPFLSSDGWNHYTIQSAIIKKEDPTT